MQLPFNFCVRQKPVGARDLIALSVLVRGSGGPGGPGGPGVRVRVRVRVFVRHCRPVSAADCEPCTPRSINL